MKKLQIKNKNAFLDDLRSKKVKIVEPINPDHITNDSLSIIQKYNLITHDAHNDNKKVHSYIKNRF